MQEMIEDIPVVGKGEKAGVVSDFDTGRRHDWVQRVSDEMQFKKVSARWKGLPQAKGTFCRDGPAGGPPSCSASAGSSRCGFPGSRGSSQSGECVALCTAADVNIAFSWQP